jgi:hypothetical protein
MKRLILICTLILIATTGLAAKQEKTLICHVGNEVGLGGETYLDDPTCVPGDVNGFFCPDAGKVDLIVVAKPAKHLNNPSHEWDGMFDYEPIEVLASGDGTEDSDGNGIDDGCEPADVCPCWAESELQAITAADNLLISCDPAYYPTFLFLWAYEREVLFLAQAIHSQLCSTDSTGTIALYITQAEADICMSQLAKRCADIGHPVTNGN